jgi:predicted amidohydrolase YtcJ
MRTVVVLHFVLAVGGAIAAGQSPQPTFHRSPGNLRNLKPFHADPETIFVNGVIYTGEGFDRDKPQTVEAMAVGGGRVLAVGTSEEMKRLAGPRTAVRDLKGTAVFPGFNDAHTHLGSAGQTKLNVDLTGVLSLEAMLKSVQGMRRRQSRGIG